MISLLLIKKYYKRVIFNFWIENDI